MLGYMYIISLYLFLFFVQEIVHLQNPAYYSVLYKRIQVMHLSKETLADGSFKIYSTTTHQWPACLAACY